MAGRESHYTQFRILTHAKRKKGQKGACRNSLCNYKRPLRIADLFLMSRKNELRKQRHLASYVNGKLWKPCPLGSDLEETEMGT